MGVDPGKSRRLYRAGLVSRADGDRSEQTQVITVTPPGGPPQTTTIEELKTDDSYVFTAMAGWQGPHDLRLWAGLLEDSAGAQVDVPFYDRKLWLSVQAFDFDRPLNLSPNLRLTGRWQFHKNLYLLGGWEDALEEGSLFLGGGVRWEDETFKYLLTSAPGL